MNGTDALLALLRAFDGHDIPYMVVGSYSSNFYGIPRMTKDADVVVHLASADWAGIPGILPDGIAMQDQMSFEMVTATRREILQVEGSRFEIELFRLSDDAHDQARFLRRKRVEIFQGSRVCLPTPEDVIIQKLRWCRNAKRGKDYDDVVAVMATLSPEVLDREYLEHWCGEHETLDLLVQARAEASGFKGPRG